MMFEAREGARHGLWIVALTAAAAIAACFGAADGAFAQEAPAAAAEPTSGSSESSVEAGRAKSATCAACHGADGNSVTPEWPSLAGQHPAYIVNQLMAYKNGERQDPGMRGFASMLSEQDMRDLAAFYSAQTLVPKGADPDLAGRGQEIYRGGVPERGIPACIACHGPAGQGNYLAAYPRIAGQHQTYLLKTMGEYADGTRRSDTDFNQMMRNVAEMLLEDEMRAVTSYVQGLTR